MLRDMNNRIKDQLSRASNEQDRMSRRRLGFGSSLTVLQEDHVRTAQGSSDRYEYTRVGFTHLLIII